MQKHNAPTKKEGPKSFICLIPLSLPILGFTFYSTFVLFFSSPYFASKLQFGLIFSLLSRYFRSSSFDGLNHCLFKFFGISILIFSLNFGCHPDSISFNIHFFDHLSCYLLRYWTIFQVHAINGCFSLSKCINGD